VLLPHLQEESGGFQAIEKDCGGDCPLMKRRGFFAALLGPLVVPWAKPTEFITLMGPFPGPGGYTPTHAASKKRIALQVRANALMNQMVDNITLKSDPEIAPAYCWMRKDETQG